MIFIERVKEFATVMKSYRHRQVSGTCDCILKNNYFLQIIISKITTLLSEKFVRREVCTVKSSDTVNKPLSRFADDHLRSIRTASIRPLNNYPYEENSEDKGLYSYGYRKRNNDKCAARLLRKAILVKDIIN